MAYKAAGKAWLNSVVKDGKEAYIRLFNKLLELGSPYIDNFDQADREQVFKCIRDKTHPPQLLALLYFTFKLHLHKLPHTKLTVK